MKRWKQWIMSTFGISSMEANGLIILIPLLFISIFIPSAYRKYITSEEFTLPDFERMERLSQEFYEDKKEAPRTFDYSNEISSTIEKEKKEKKSGKAVDDRVKDKERTYTHYIDMFDLNEADTGVLRLVRGIGPVLSNRIVKYRDLLGGYYSLEQLHEVYGLSDSVILALDTLSIIRPSFEPLKLLINTSGENELKKHPYLTYNEAKAIVAYRFQHGDFETIEDLSGVVLLDTLKIRKLKPYLEF